MISALKIPPDHYIPHPKLLAAHNILITGASRGIGRAVAIHFAEYGAHTIISGRDVSELEKTYDTIVAAGGPTPMIAPFDLQSENENDYARFAQLLSEHYPQLNGVLHNAAFLGDLSPIADVTLSDWRTALQVNVSAVFLLTRSLLPLMQAAEYGSMILSADCVGRHPQAYWGGYAVSKCALEGLMAVLADELECMSIRVNSIDPGAVQTDMRRKAYPGEAPDQTPPPARVVNAYLYLMSADSRHCTGHKCTVHNSANNEV